MTLPTVPLSTHELSVHWTQADDRSLNRILGYFRLNTPNCEVNEFIIPIELDADHNSVPPLDRWNGLVVPWDHDLSRLEPAQAHHVLGVRSHPVRPDQSLCHPCHGRTA